MSFLIFALLLITSYLIGSISFSYLAGKALKGIDLREYGSGNLGASNTFRILGKFPGGIVLVLDVLKGFVCLLLTSYVCEKLSITYNQQAIMELLSAAAVILGHVFTLYLGFRGGKGVATSLGVFLYLAFWPIVLSFVLWLVVVKVTRYISLGSIIAAFSLPIFIYIQDKAQLCQTNPYVFYFSIPLSIFIIVKHRTNISRIISGTENKIGAQPKKR